MKTILRLGDPTYCAESGSGFDNNPSKRRKLDIVEQCTQERQNTRWRFMLITNVTVFAALLKNFQWDVLILSYLSLYYDIL